MLPLVMREVVNSTLKGANLTVRAVTFTRAGNIAIAPLAPSLAADILELTDILWGHLSHGQPPQSMVPEVNEPWPGLVVHGVHLPKGGTTEDIWTVEQRACEELGAWNPQLQDTVKNVRVMCRPEEIPTKTYTSVLIAFSSRQSAELAAREGIYMYGERCKVSTYRQGRGGAETVVARRRSSRE
jgi:hypothetical protein